MPYARVEAGLLLGLAGSIAVSRAGVRHDGAAAAAGGVRSLYKLRRRPF